MLGQTSPVRTDPASYSRLTQESAKKYPSTSSAIKHLTGSRLAAEEKGEKIFETARGEFSSLLRSHVR